ncbi:MAG TPA: hypothetical protein PKJ99_02555 [Thermoanaerobaculales bacterium]|nr:hypothetical protein [Thermoanaerobaculales bacterium]HPA79683.1 hypothetical protein [Thermoanaerobaculales bacterium]HQN97607.1 hypothetical protein [Thermoanaerobaculales bacterium]HQP44079.1 hypothetical protein [Thermoanaerobaculales bacterium]
MASQQLMRRFVALVAIAVGMAATPALAQSVSGAVGHASNVTIADPRDGPAAPWSQEQYAYHSQISNPSGGGAPAQDFEAAYDAYDCSVGDDFQVTWPDGWQIMQIHTPGSYNLAGPALGIVYGFFSDAGGLPGTTLCSGTAAIVSDVSGDIVSELPLTCFLYVPDTYWVSVAARMDYGSSGQWWVSAETVTHGNIARWINPGDAFGTGCTSWSSCLLTVVDADYRDMSFELLSSVLFVPIFIDDFESGDTSWWSLTVP